MEIIDKWVAEFFLFRQQNPRVFANTLFSSLKSPDSVKLKITAVLRDVSNSLIRGTIDERILDLLEILERLLLQEERSVTTTMESLKSAYCWTAVECTVRFMWPVTASDGVFNDALERIWMNRIGILKEKENDLVTHELLKWESELNMAFEEPEVYQKIRETNIRYIAICHLNQLLEEQWALLECSSLELEARKRFLKRRVGDREGRSGDNREEVGDVEEVGGVVNPDGVGDKVNEEVEEHEPSLNKGDITVAQELKDCLLEIRGIIEQEPNNAIDDSVDVTPQADQANGTEIGGGQGRNEAEDSQGTSSSLSGRVRSRLPTPEPLNVSPVKKDESAKPCPRRAMKFWTPEEVEALREGVKEYGKSWKDIKNSNPLVFADRTEVDLKDKWRNLFGR